MESKRCGGLIGSPLKCDLCIVGCWPNGDQSLHFLPSLTTEDMTLIFIPLAHLLQAPIYTVQPWFVTLPVERGAWGLPWAFSPALGLGVTAHLPQC